MPTVASVSPEMVGAVTKFIRKVPGIGTACVNCRFCSGGDCSVVGDAKLAYITPITPAAGHMELGVHPIEKVISEIPLLPRGCPIKP